MRLVFALRAIPIGLAVSLPARADDEVLVRGAQAGGFSSRVRIEDQPREVTDAASLIEGEPGVHVRRLGGDDGFATVSIRGASSSQIAVILAGVPLTGGGTPVIDLGSLPLWPGVRARVFRTFAPAALGPGSLGGTLAWDAPSAREPERVESWAAAGSFGALRARAGMVGAWGSRRLVVGASASRADNDFTAYDPALQRFERRVNADVAQASVMSAMTAPYSLGQGREGSVTVLALGQLREQGVPGSIFVPSPEQRLRTDRELATVLGTHPATNMVSAYAQWWARREGLSLRDAKTRDPSRADQYVFAMGIAAGVRGRPLADFKGDVRVEGRGERFQPGELVGSAPSFGATRSAIAGAADLEWTKRALTLAASARLEHLRDAIGARFQEETVSAVHGGAELSSASVAFALHGGYTSRAPSFLERYGVTGGYLPTPDLKSESAWALDGGARLRRKLGKLDLSAEATGFLTFARDLIVFVPQGFRGLPKAQNVGEAWLAGLEARARAKLQPLELRASYTLMASENRAACTIDGCPLLPGRPLHDVVLDAVLDAGPFVKLRWGLDVIAGMRFDNAGTIEIPPRALQSAGARFAPSKRLEWSLDIRNLTDERTATYPLGALGPVREPIGDAIFYPLPGRTVLLSLKVSGEP